MDQKIYQNILTFDITQEIRRYLKLMGKCVDQVYFVEKRSRQQELKFC